MGSNKSSRIVKGFLGKNKSNETKEPEDSKQASAETNEEKNLTEQTTEEETGKQGTKRRTKKSTKVTKKRKAPSAQQVIFSNRTISNLSRALGPNDWIRLAYALGFLPQGIANFTGRASSSQNSYSQCTMMLRTWREQTSADEILPRLSDALQKIRRHDLAVKISLELAICASDIDQKYSSNLPKDLLQLINESKSDSDETFTQNKIVFTDDNVSFLARQLLAREEWKRLAYALGFLPDEASHIIATASSSQNLYAQAHVMLIKYRERTPSHKLISNLRAGFTRIRRHDLVFLLDLGVIVGPEDAHSASAKENLKKLYEEHKKPKATFGEHLTRRFSELHKV